jgi:FkbM family methyltransferase
MFNWMKKAVLDTPVERLARRLYIRLDPSPAGKYDRATLAVMRRHITPRSNCVDVGAHRGSILSEMVALAPQGRHYAFEPLPEAYRYLANTYPTVRVLQLALSNEKKQASFTHVIHHPTRSGFKQPPGSREQTETITVSTDRLDNVLPAGQAIHFIKIDVEGAEFQVLLGSIQTIQRHRPLVLFEHSLASWECFGASSEDLYHLLTREGGLKIWLLPDWLAGGPFLAVHAFARHVEQGAHCYFVAHAG